MLTTGNSNQAIRRALNGASPMKKPWLGKPGGAFEIAIIGSWCGIRRAHEVHIMCGRKGVAYEF